MIGILILTHGEFGENLLKTACAIMKETDKVGSLNLSRREEFSSLREKVLHKIDQLRCEDGILILIDAYGGTSYNTTLPLMKKRNICLVTGVNLPMLLSALTNRKRLSLRALSGKVSQDAKKTISTMYPLDVEAK